MKVTIIATGFEKEKEPYVAATPVAAPAPSTAHTVAAKAEPAPAPAPIAHTADEISDDDLDELLGMLQNKERKAQESRTTDYPSGLKRYF